MKNQENVLFFCHFFLVFAECSHKSMKVFADWSVKWRLKRSENC